MCVRINVIEDVENNKSLKEAVKSRLAESRGLWREESEEKSQKKSKFPDEVCLDIKYPRCFSFLGWERRTVFLDIVNDVRESKENDQKYHREEDQNSDEEKKENSCCRKKNYPLGNIESRNATYPTYSLNWNRNSWLEKKHVLSSYSSEYIKSEYIKSEFNLFSLLPTQISIESSQ